MYNTSITVVAALAAALIPIASAIQLTNLNIPTLTSGQSYDLEWSGDGSVREPNFAVSDTTLTLV